MIQGDTMPRDRIRKTYTLGPDDLARLDRIAAVKTGGNSSRALSLALELAALVLERPGTAGAATAAEALEAYRADPTPGGRR